MQRQRDLKVISNLYLKGWIQQDIANYLNARDEPDTNYEISRGQVFVDIKAIQKKWLDSALYDFNKAKAKELAKIDLREEEAWAAWERSCGEETIEEQKEFMSRQMAERAALSGNGNVKPVVLERKRRKRKLVGDPRFLDIVQRCSEQRCKILGFLKDVNINNTVVQQKFMINGQEIVF